MAGQVIHTVSSEKVENLWITGEILTIQIAELALYNADDCLVTADVAKQSGFTLEGLLQMAIQGSSTEILLTISCEDMKGNIASRVKVRFSVK